MYQNEQEQPFAPASQRISSSGHRPSLSVELKDHDHRPRHRNFIICGCVAAVLLIIVVVILVLSFTVFHIKEPVMNLNVVQIQGLELLGTNVAPTPGSTNLTVLADVSVKNPNVASFKFSDVTTGLYYDDVLVGEARTPPGKAQARRTLRLNVTIDVMVEKFVAVRRLSLDLAAGALLVSSYSSISGRVKVLFVKKDVLVRLNCTMNVNVTSGAIQDRKCRSHVSA